MLINVNQLAMRLKYKKTDNREYNEQSDFYDRETWIYINFTLVLY